MIRCAASTHRAGTLRPLPIVLVSNLDVRMWTSEQNSKHCRKRACFPVEISAASHGTEGWQCRIFCPQPAKMKHVNVRRVDTEPPPQLQKVSVPPLAEDCTCHPEASEACAIRRVKQQQQLPEKVPRNMFA